MRTVSFYLLISIFISALFSACKKKEKPLETFTKLALLFAASTYSRCQINSAVNADYFTANSVPSGGTVSVGRAQLQNGNVSMDVYYPQDGSVSLPVLVLFQGGNVHSSFYSKYAARLASAGYTVFVGNRCDLFIFQYFIYPPASLGNIALSMADSQNSNSSSVLYKRLDTGKIGFLGHSLGGVVGLYAMNNICEFPFCTSGYQFLSQVKAGIFYGSGLGSSFSSSRFYTINGKGLPTGYIQGSKDGANKPETGSASCKNAIAPKVYFSVEGANHYGVTDQNNPYGANAESSSALLSQSESTAKIAEASLVFLDAYIKGNGAALAKITSGNIAISNVTVTSEQ